MGVEETGMSQCDWSEVSEGGSGERWRRLEAGVVEKEFGFYPRSDGRPLEG